MKKCSICDIEKSLDLFIKSKRNKSGFGAVCISCNKIRSDKYRLENPEKVKLSQKNSTYSKSIERKQYLKNWKQINRDRINELRLKTHNEKMNDPVYKLKHNLRININNSIKRQKYVKNNVTTNILGCNYEEFIRHIEKQFEPWMSWSNYGGKTNEKNIRWDLDHIIPISSAKTEEEVMKLNHYTNLRPLCSYTNRWIKSNKIEYYER